MISNGTRIFIHGCMAITSYIQWDTTSNVSIPYPVLLPRSESHTLYATRRMVLNASSNNLSPVVGFMSTPQCGHPLRSFTTMYPRFGYVFVLFDVCPHGHVHTHKYHIGICAYGTRSCVMRVDDVRLFPFPLPIVQFRRRRCAIRRTHTHLLTMRPRVHHTRHVPTRCRERPTVDEWDGLRFSLYCPPFGYVFVFDTCVHTDTRPHTTIRVVW